MTSSKVLLLSALLLSCRPEKLVPVPPCEPSEEVCDGVDNDCDGKIDESLTRGCFTECGRDTQVCFNGEWSECRVRKPSPEVCDGIDNDCNGLIDNDITVRPCYSGDPSDLGILRECRYGIEACLAGKFKCVGDVTPVAETCNGKDDNCDGTIDEDVSDPIDFAMLFDFSCSMIDNFDNVKSQNAAWISAISGRKNVRIALIGVPGPDPFPDGVPSKMIDFTDPVDFMRQFSQVASSYRSDEPTIDGSAMVCDKKNPGGLSWAPGSKRVAIMFTDEPPQSFVTPRLTAMDVFPLCWDSSTSLYVFADSLFDWSQFSMPTSNMKIISLEPPDQIEQKLNDILKENACR